MSTPSSPIINDGIVPVRCEQAEIALRRPWRRWLRGLMLAGELAAGIVLALFWLRSALAHVTNPYYFLSSVYSYEIVGPSLGVTAAMTLPALQLVLAASLLARRFVGGALLISSLLLCVFVAVQASALARGLNIACGCFGAAGRQPLGGESLATTSLLLVCALGAFFVHSIVAHGVGGGSPAANCVD